MHDKTVRLAVLSFTIEGIHPHDIATILDEDGIAIRAGHHCCQILHDKLGLTATARASLGVYNTKDDLDKLNEGINNCKKITVGYSNDSQIKAELVASDKRNDLAGNIFSNTKLKFLSRRLITDVFLKVLGSIKAIVLANSAE